MSAGSDFDLGRYLVALDTTERSHWQDELKQIDANAHVEKLFQDVGFEPIPIRNFDPDIPLLMTESGRKAPYINYAARCRAQEENKIKRETEREQRRREEEKKKQEERERRWEEQCRIRAEERQRKEEEARKRREEAWRKIEEEQKAARQARIDKDFWVYRNDLFKFTRDNIFGMQTIDEDHVLYLCAVQTTRDMWCIVILFDGMAYVSSDMLIPNDNAWCMKGWFEHLFVYEKLEDHLRKYITDTKRIIEIGTWLKETKRSIMDEFGFGPANSDTYYCVHKERNGLLRCNMATYKCTWMSCIYYRHCTLCDDEIAHSARVWEFQIPEDWI